MFRRTSFLAIAVVCSLHGLGQEIDIESFIEDNFDWQDQALPYEDIYESLYLLYTQPLNLNSANEDELSQLFLLTPPQIKAILQYRSENGSLLTIYELQAIPGLDLATIRKIQPFVTIKPKTEGDLPFLSRVRKAPNSYMLVRNTRRIETAAGFRDGSYLGDKNHLYTRFRTSNPGDFSFGFTVEKDPGEQLAWNDQVKGFDHSTVHFQLQNKGLFNNLIIGDYQLQFGQGLVFGAGFTPGKGAETILTTRRGNAGLQPFASVIESGFFRGAAATMQLGNHEWTLMLSRLRQDGNRVTDMTYSDFEEFVNSIQITGLHRTENELAAKNNIVEQNLGFNWLYRRGKAFTLGAALIHSQFNVPIQRKPNNYNQYEFTGSQHTIGSSYLTLNWQNILLFGEAAITSSAGMGAVGGALLTVTDKIGLSIVGRNYQPDFNSFYGNAFSEGSRIINEKGVYWGLSFTPSRQHKVNAYYDRFVFPWLKFGVDAPSSGEEWLFRYTYRPNKTGTFYAQIRKEIKQESETEDGQNLSTLIDRAKWQYITNYDAQVTSWLSLKTRLQGSIVSRNNRTSSGIALMQDFVIKAKPFKISTRFALFDTDDFDNRQYVFERNVLYAFSIPAYNGTGIRQYLLAEYALNRKITLYARYARFDLSNVESIGSGRNETEGNVRSEWNAQLRIKL